MRKILIIVILLVMSFSSYYIFTNGLNLVFFKVKKYEELQTASQQLNFRIKELETKNTSEYEAKKTQLASAVKEYYEQKETYEKLLASKQEMVSEESFSTMDLYDIDFLWTIIGNYATEEGVELKFEVNTSSNSASSIVDASSNEEYILCDLKFTVLGSYIDITDFIYDIEDDDRLGFEIRDFALEKIQVEETTKNEENKEVKKTIEKLQGTFNVKSIPINNKNLNMNNIKDDTNTTKSTTNTITE